MKYVGTKQIETERLILRKIVRKDAYKAYENWCNSDKVSQYVLWEKHKNVEETLKLYEDWVLKYGDPKTFRWIIERKEDKELIGTNRCI